MFIFGVLLGGMLGLCGNIYTTWFYENFKNTFVWEDTVMMSIVIFFGTIIASVIILLRLLKDTDL